MEPCPRVNLVFKRSLQVLLDVPWRLAKNDKRAIGNNPPLFTGTAAPRNSKRPGDIGRKEGINGDASGQAATDVPGPGEELSTWWARVMGLEKFIPSSTRRHVLTYGHLPDLRLTCDPTSRGHGQEAVIYSLQS